MTKLRSLLFVCASVAALSACSSQVMTTAEGRLDRDYTSAQEMSDMFDRVQTKSGPTNLVVEDGLYLGNDGRRIRTGDALPAKYEGEYGIVLKSSARVNVVAFAEMVHKATGIRVIYDDLMNAPSGEGSVRNDADMSHDPFQNPSFTDNASAGADPTSTQFWVEYEGPLSGILDRVAANLGADWTYEGGVVKLIGPQTRSYAVAIDSSTLSTSSTVSSTSSSLQVDYWRDFEDGLKAALPDKNASYSLNRTTGSLVVTGTDATHERVARFIAGENDRLSRQVAVTVDIVSWTSNESDARSTNINAVLNSVLENSLDLSFSNPAGVDAVGPRVSGSILDGDLSGTTAVLDVLNRHGRASLLNTTSVVALNNTPTPVKVAQETSYVSNVTTTRDDDGTASTDLVASTVDSGLDLVVTPRILGDGDIYLKMSGKLTDIIDISEFSSAGSQVQLPITSVSELMQSVSLENGQTMLIASTSRSKADRDRQGPFSPAAWGLGGRSNATVENTKIFVLVRPQILDEDTQKGLFR
ncbi:hypothetical protein [Tranquillimonas alkanivorans]|uniref:Type IVB pilus formation outer membrane protein, R64 PilN family n=1 Tax=Tranquillimonas alkanivorans TaxID=441119 RepID=A0A1I5V1T2_9RHOB|nr:hypothetical protein [Tranquillimonas alkanivorans]SFQ01439.1 type IVB pilus formation outer membrane protein, R64 PilN family [Tranquillimonas alkanivorans]